jgi:hypothetical protein
MLREVDGYEYDDADTGGVEYLIHKDIIEYLKPQPIWAKMWKTESRFNSFHMYHREPLKRTGAVLVFGGRGSILFRRDYCKFALAILMKGGKQMVDQYLSDGTLSLPGVAEPVKVPPPLAYEPPAALVQPLPVDDADFPPIAMIDEAGNPIPAWRIKIKKQERNRLIREARMKAASEAVASSRPAATETAQ